MSRLLREKLILYDNGADYNQVVWLAGGAGSGKGFALNNFMEREKFRVVDVDRFKKFYLELDDKYPGLGDLDLQNPEDVSKLHRFVKDKGIKDEFVSNLLSGSVEGRLPNILFDTTLDDLGKVHDYLPQLKALGYPSENMHITWVLTDYEISVKRNRSRERIVPDDVLLKTHKGAASTMVDIIRNGTPKGVDGSVRVILNNPEHSVTYDREPTRDDAEVPIKDFKYVTLKEAGEPFKSQNEVRTDIFQWIKNNTPKESSLWRAMA